MQITDILVHKVNPPHYGLPLGIAAYMQLAAAIPYLSQPGQSLFRWYADDVISELI